MHGPNGVLEMIQRCMQGIQWLINLNQIHHLTTMLTFQNLYSIYNLQFTIDHSCIMVATIPKFK